MTETTNTHPTESIASVPALVTFWLLAIWTLVIIGVFSMAAARIPIEGVMLGVLSGIIGTQTTLLVAAVSFWVGSNVGAKQARDSAAKDNDAKTAVIAQLATTSQEKTS